MNYTFTIVTKDEVFTRLFQESGMFPHTMVAAKPVFDSELTVARELTEEELATYISITKEAVIETFGPIIIFALAGRPDLQYVDPTVKLISNGITVIHIEDAVKVCQK